MVCCWKGLEEEAIKVLRAVDKITTSLATFETLISLSIDGDSVIDAKEFHKLQTLYLQLMTHVRNVDRKMKVQTEENFQKTIMDEIVNIKKGSGTKVVSCSTCLLFNCLYYKKDG